MKICTIAIALAVVTFTSSAIADAYVRGHSRHNGAYVHPHYRSNADRNPYNNYSTRGNVNPYTGRAGTVSPSYGSRNSYGSRSTGRSNSYGGYNSGRRGYGFRN